jgi:PAS domain-containing protein
MDTTVTSMLHDPIIDGIVVNCRDITERKLAEEMTKATEDKYRLFFENSMDGILLTDPDGNIAAANAAACGIFQMTEKELCRVGRKGIVDFSDPTPPGAAGRAPPDRKNKRRSYVYTRRWLYIPGRDYISKFQGRIRKRMYLNHHPGCYRKKKGRARSYRYIPSIGRSLERP